MSRFRMKRTTATWILAAVSLAWAIAFASGSHIFASVAAAVTLAGFVVLVAPTAPIGGAEVSADVVAPGRRPDLPVAPDSLEPRAVVRALFANAAGLGDVVAAHLWVHDEASGTLRLVAADGPVAPGPHPVGMDDDVLGRAVSEGVVVAREVSLMTTAETGQRVVARVAMPVGTQDIRGVAAIDIAGGPPDGEAITELGGQMRVALASALALSVARDRTSEALGLIEAARELSRALDPDDVIALSLKRAIHMSAAATGSIMMLDENGRSLRIVAAEGLPADVVDSTSVSVGEGIAGWVAASRQPVLVEDLPGRSGHGGRRGVRSAVSVPIADEDGLLGVLNVGSRTFPARFTKEHLDTLEMLGRQTAVALRNATAVSSARDLYFDTLKALALALETKDPYAAGGTERVVEYASAIANAMNVDTAQRKAVEIAAMLHDIGMSALGPFGSDCARPLSVMERGLLKMHPAVAAEILEQAPALREVAPIVYHHHEHYDGQGYAAGISGEAIPLGARILAVADAFVAMTSARPYRTALSDRRAVQELRERAGTQFDPEVVRAFIELLGSDSNRVPYEE